MFIHKRCIYICHNDLWEEDRGPFAPGFRLNIKDEVIKEIKSMSGYFGSAYFITLDATYYAILEDDSTGILIRSRCMQ